MTETMSGRRSNKVLVLLIALVSLLGAGCSGVPRSSSPEVVKTIAGAGDADNSIPSVLPPAGADPRTIVQKFLQEAVQNTSGAKQFLTDEAQRKWQPTPIVVVDDYQVRSLTTTGNGTGRINVAATSRIGQVDATGVYTPTLLDATSSDVQTQTFVLKQVSGQWRIDQLSNGTWVSKADFAVDFAPQALYFFDSTETQLIPDQRYTSLTGQLLLQWLLAQLVAGPRPELQSSVVNELPDQVVPRQVTASIGSTITVDIPTAASIDTAGKERLAAQLAYSLRGINSSDAISLTDTGRPVSISPTIGTSFSPDDFIGVGPDAPLPPSVQLYLHNGQLMNGATNKPVPGPLGAAGLNLSSIAARGADPGDLNVIAVTGNKAILGTSGAGYVPVTGLLGQLGQARPEWQPRTSNAWIGAGSAAAIFRIDTKGVAKQVSVTPTLGAPLQGQVLALRFSPDGARIAAVITSTGGAQSVWIGSVVRSGTDVGIDKFEQITPPTLDVADLAWNDDTKLLLVAAAAPAMLGDAGLWSVLSDGSELKQESVEGLPESPQTVAAAPGDSPVVSVDGTLWVRIGGEGWDAFVSGDGDTSPVYTQP